MSMMIEPRDTRLKRIRTKLESGKRLGKEEGIQLYETADLLGLGGLAHGVRWARHGRKAYFVYNQHLNYTNICKNRCAFCAFARDAGEAGGYVMSLDRVEAAVTERLHEPITEIHVVGGVNPDLEPEYYFNLVRRIKQARPEVVVKAFSAVEIHHLARIAGLTLTETLERLKDCGLESLPGGGAEVFSSRVRNRLFPGKISAEEWMEVMRKAHEAGIRSNATLLYGHIETIEERVDHLLQLRRLQDETGGFMAFIPLAFHSKNTRLSHISPTTGYLDLKTVAVSRLLLDNIPHIKAYWVMLGLKTAQVALNFGADDLDGTVVRENITHAAGADTPTGLSPDELSRLIKEAGFEPVERDAFYHPVEDRPRAFEA